MLTTQPAPSSHDEERFEAIYAEHFEFLVGVAVHKFHIHESEAETLVHEVFLSYLKKHDSLPDQLAARQALECLTPRCQRVLYLRYFEGCSILELAERMGVRPKRAQK